MQTVTASWLQSIESLREVPLEQLQWLIDQSEHYELAEGEFLFKTGSPIRGTHIIIDGRIKVYILQGKEAQDLGYFESKEISGYMPFSRGLVSIGTGEVIKHSQIMTFPIEKTRELINLHFELTQ